MNIHGIGDRSDELYMVCHNSSKRNIFIYLCGTEGLSSAIIASGKQSVEFLLSVLGVFCFLGWHYEYYRKIRLK